MATVWGELKRRNVVRVAVAYTIVSWLILQLTDVLMPLLSLSQWVGGLVFLLLVIGFFLALILSWAYELTPEGVKLEKHVGRSQSIIHITGRKLDFIIIGVLMIALLMFALDKFVWTTDVAPVDTANTQQRTIAVLSFINMSSDPEQEYFSDGLAEELINLLARISELRVTSRSSAFFYKGKDFTIADVGRDLGVGYVLEGSVQRVGDGVRINVQLIDTDTDESLWAETYDRELATENIFAIQREIATSIAGELQATLSLEEVARIGVLPTQSTIAYDLYVRGRFFWNQRTEEGFNRALEYLNQAIEEDPNYALAYAGVASIYVLMGNELFSWSHPRDSYPKAQAAARRALELDDTLAEAHSVLGDALFRYDWDFISADREHQRAIALNPNYGTGHQWYSHYLLPMGREKESLAHSLRALELDPLNLIINLHLGWHYFYVGENELAIEQLQQTLELSPTFIVANLFLGQVYEQEMRLEEAIEQFEWAADLSDRNPVHLAALAHAYGISGRQKDAETLLQELVSSEQYVPSYEIAVIYAGLDRQDEALTWLERAYEEKDSSWLVDVALDPRFQQLHSTSRFQSLTRRLGLP